MFFSRAVKSGKAWAILPQAVEESGMILVKLSMHKERSVCFCPDID